MIDIGIGISEDADAVAAAKEAAKTALRAFAPAAKIGLGLVFSTKNLPGTLLLKTIHNYIEGVPILGCSGSALISNHGILRQAVGVLLLGFPKGVYFNTAAVKGIKELVPVKAGELLGDKLLYGCRNVRRDFGIMFSDVSGNEQAGLLSGLQDKLGRSFPFVGGFVGTPADPLKSHIYYNQELLADSASGILVGGGKLYFGSRIRHGWKPLGKPRTVTFSQGNVVYEIDGAPAAKLYENYLAKDIAELKKIINRISALYPVGIHLENENSYLLRKVVSIVESGALLFQGEVPQGSQIRLMIGTRDSCLEAVREAAEEAKKELSNQAAGTKKTDTSRFILVLDSIFRHMLLSRQARQEIEIIQAVFGKDTPIIGISTSSEVASLQTQGYHGKVYFHNQCINIMAVEG